MVQKSGLWFKAGFRCKAAGGKDHLSPAALNESNARRYLESKAVTVYEEFPLRSHFTLGEEGWEQVADYALTWAIENAAAPPARDHLTGLTTATGLLPP